MLPRQSSPAIASTRSAPAFRLRTVALAVAVATMAGLAVGAPLKAMLARRGAQPETSRTPLAETGRRPVRSQGAISSAQLAQIPMNLTFVDTARTPYTRFKTWVDTAVAGNPGYAYQARDSALMYRITRDGKYCTHAVKMVETQVAQAETAIAAGQNPEVAYDSYLDVGPMIGDLSMTYDTCAAFLTAAQRTRWSAYAEQAVWNVWNYQNAKWGSRSAPWSGWSIDNPGNNYHYSFLEATMYWALASRSNTWMSLLKTDKLPKLEAYYRALGTGGSQEGTGYGTAQMRLFEIYRLWRDATGIDLANANPHESNTIRWWVHATVPTLDRFAPLGDQSRSSTPDIYDYHRRLVLEARHLTQDATAQRIASWWLNNISVQQMGSGFNFRYDLLPAGTGGTAPSELYYLGSGTGHLFARTGWDKAAMWMSYVAGPYMESHAHQDQGAFTLFANDWLSVTENIWTHSGIQQGSEVHNTLRFERNNTSASQCGSPANDKVVHQCYGTTSTMTVTPGAGGALTVASNLAPAYAGTTYVKTWTRALDFSNRKLTVRDNFTLGSGTTATFQVQTPVQPTVSGTTITAGKLKVRVLEPTNATITLRNWNSVDASEYTKGWRIDIAGGTTTYLVELSEAP